MARWKRTSEEVKAKVIELKIWNIELSSYDIAGQLKGTEYEVSADTVQDILKELPQLTANSEKWRKQIERLDTIISWIEEITSKTVNTLRQKDELSVKDVKDLNDIAKNNWERKRLLEWNSTANVSILWEILDSIWAKRPNLTNDRDWAN